MDNLGEACRMCGEEGKYMQICVGVHGGEGSIGRPTRRLKGSIIREL